ncbi:F-box/LRR-repeat protein At5g02910 [Linum perenne]
MATETTNKRIKSATDDTEGRDLISELPEEIIHQVLRRIASPAKAARTTALSRRWRSVWSCYPVLKFRHSYLPRPTVDKRLENFKKFVTFNEEENTSNPTRIDHLKYCADLSNSKVDKRALLEALFMVCRPNHLTLIHRHKNSERFFQVCRPNHLTLIHRHKNLERFFQGFLSLMQQKGGADESLMWLNGLKDVKIITRDVDVEIEEEEELIMGYSTCKTQNQLCLELTWG